MKPNFLFVSAALSVKRSDILALLAIGMMNSSILYNQ
jgi:hypothetical protein